MNSFSAPSSSTPSGAEQKSAQQHQSGAQHLSSSDSANKSGSQDSSWAAGEMASNAASAVGTQVKGMLDHQVGSGADMLHAFASSVMHAADELDKESPQLAGLVRSAAGRLDEFSKNMHDRSVDELVQSASDFTRRQPALVFGLAALAGFLAMRTVRNASSAHMHSRGNGMHSQSGGMTRTGYHGV